MKTHEIRTGENVIDGKALDIKDGDTIALLGGKRERLHFINLPGNPDKPVKITNKNGVAKTEKGRYTYFENCGFVEVRADKVDDRHGIFLRGRVQNRGPLQGIIFGGIKLEHLDDGSGIGIKQRDKGLPKIELVVIKNCHLTGLKHKGEACYIGSAKVASDRKNYNLGIVRFIDNIVSDWGEGLQARGADVVQVSGNQLSGINPYPKRIKRTPNYGSNAGKPGKYYMPMSAAIVIGHECTKGNVFENQATNCGGRFLNWIDGNGDVYQNVINGIGLEHEAYDEGIVIHSGKVEISHNQLIDIEGLFVRIRSNVTGVKCYDNLLVDPDGRDLDAIIQYGRSRSGFKNNRLLRKMEDHPTPDKPITPTKPDPESELAVLRREMAAMRSEIVTLREGLADHTEDQSERFKKVREALG